MFLEISFKSSYLRGLLWIKAKYKWNPNSWFVFEISFFHLIFAFIPRDSIICKRDRQIHHSFRKSFEFAVFPYKLDKKRTWIQLEFSLVRNWWWSTMYVGISKVPVNKRSSTILHSMNAKINIHYSCRKNGFNRWISFKLNAIVENLNKNSICKWFQNIKLILKTRAVRMLFCEPIELAIINFN